MFSSGRVPADPDGRRSPGIVADMPCIPADRLERCWQQIHQPVFRSNPSPDLGRGPSPLGPAMEERRAVRLCLPKRR